MLEAKHEQVLQFQQHKCARTNQSLEIMATQSPLTGQNFSNFRNLCFAAFQ